MAEDIGSEVNQESLNHLAMIKNRARRAKLLISDLLLYSRIGSDAEEHEIIDFNQVVTHCLDQCNANQFQLNIDGCDLLLPKQSFNSVLMHLISNAVKHHLTGSGKISVKCKKMALAYRIEVSDDGPGINPMDHKKVFKKFQTLKSRDQVEGSGMGLASVKKILSLYAAQISLVSDGQSGSTFIVEWPLDPNLRD